MMCLRMDTDNSVVVAEWGEVWMEVQEGIGEINGDEGKIKKYILKMNTCYRNV